MSGSPTHGLGKYVRNGGILGRNMSGELESESGRSLRSKIRSKQNQHFANNTCCLIWITAEWGNYSLMNFCLITLISRKTATICSAKLHGAFNGVLKNVVRKK